MQTLNHSSSYRLMWVAGSVLILSSVASIAAVLAWKTIPSGSNSVAPTSSAAPSSTVVTKAYMPTLAPPISYPLGENMEMMALLDLHQRARNRLLDQDYKIAVVSEDGPSRLVQKAVRNLAD